MSAPDGRVSPPVPVLREDDVWPDWQPAFASLGPRWTGPSGRTYVLALHGSVLDVSLEVHGIEPAVPRAVVEADLLELACAAADLVGGEWSGAGIKESTSLWGYAPDHR